jgi:hypothetical protein
MLRSLVHAHRIVAAWMIALALVVKILVPAGYMIGADAGTITVVLCSGSGQAQMVMPISGSDRQDHQGKAMPCAFSGLSAPSVAGADPLVLAVAIAFIIETALRVVAAQQVEAPLHLRPHLRGPPAA